MTSLKRAGEYREYVCFRQYVTNRSTYGCIILQEENTKQHVDFLRTII